MASLEIGYRLPSGFNKLSSSAILEYVRHAVAYGSFFFGPVDAVVADGYVAVADTLLIFGPLNGVAAANEDEDMRLDRCPAAVKWPAEVL